MKTYLIIRVLNEDRASALARRERLRRAVTRAGGQPLPVDADATPFVSPTLDRAPPLVSVWPSWDAAWAFRLSGRYRDDEAPSRETTPAPADLAP